MRHRPPPRLLTLPDDLTKVSEVRLQMLYLQTLSGIHREIRTNLGLKRLCKQSDKVQAEVRRREWLRDKDKAP